MCYEECSCQVLISEISDCGHIIQGKCSDIENKKCDIKVYYLYSRSIYDYFNF